MLQRADVIGILLIVGIPFLLLLFDSRWNQLTYRCESATTYTLYPNSPDHVNAIEIRLEGEIAAGEVNVFGFRPDQPASGDKFTAGSSASLSYDNEWYSPLELTFRPSAGASCELRVVYRLQSTLSLLNPLW